MHKRPEAHAACTAFTASHCGGSTASAALQGQSRALEEPGALIALKEAEPAHCMQTFMAGSVPSVGAAPAMTAPALTAAPPQVQDVQISASPHTGPAEAKTTESCCMPASAILGYWEPQNCLALSVPAPCDSSAPATSEQLGPYFAALEVTLLCILSDSTHGVVQLLSLLRTVSSDTHLLFTCIAGCMDSVHSRTSPAKFCHLSCLHSLLIHAPQPLAKLQLMNRRRLPAFPAQITKWKVFCQDFRRVAEPSAKGSEVLP